VHGLVLYNETYQAPAGHWEGRTHYACLYRNREPLGIVSELSVSPSRRYVLYLHGVTGTWMLVDGDQDARVVGSVDRSFAFFWKVRMRRVRRRGSDSLE
jgi:hypothetical protein